MSNPLIRPNDPRFQRPPLRDAAGNNVFADPDAPIPAEPADGAPVPAQPAKPDAGNLFAPPAAIEGPDPAYRPQFETTHAHRGTLLLVLAVLGLVLDSALVLMLSPAGLMGLVGLLAIGPSSLAWLLGRADLAAMRQGAIDPNGLAQTRLAMWLGLGGTIFYVAVLLAILAFLGLVAATFVQDG